MFNHTFPTGTLWNTDALDLMQQMPDESVDMIFTDPPYRVISGGTEHSKARGQFKMFANASASGDGKIFKHNDVAIADYLPHFYRLLKPSTHCYVMTNNINLRELLNVGESVGFHFHNLLRWDKPNVNANRWYMKDCEYVVFFAKKPAKTINMAGSKQGFKCALDRSIAKSHPTEKPVDLVRHYIENSTMPDNLVFDPFIGSGATALAAIQSGRRWIGCEIDPQYWLASMLRLSA